MLSQVLVEFVDLFVSIFDILLVTRVIMSYFAKPGNRIFAGLVNMTEPLLGPVRKLLPQTPGVDFAPLAAFFLLELIQFLVNTFL
jgi:YggT family protein